MSSLTSQQRVVVVLGMHRSGTSLLANLLTALGVDLGDNLLPADANNQAGYWEQQDIYQAQDELLNYLGRRWIGPEGSLPFPSEWWRLPEVAPFKERLVSIVRNEVECAHGIWGFKDPRTSRLLPLWNEIFAELSLQPVYLLAIREPASVVESVMKRDEIPAAHAELQWLLHNLDAVRDAKAGIRAVVDYDRWFTHPREQAISVAHALNGASTANIDEFVAQISQRVKPDLRHCLAPRTLSLPFVAEAYELLKQAAVAGEIPQGLRSLDGAVRQSMALCQPWAAAILEGQSAPALGQFSFVDHFAEGRVEKLGPTGQAAVWSVKMDAAAHPTLFLHPPARLHFCVTGGDPGRLTFAVAVHPDAWNKPRAGGCEFIASVDNRVVSAISIDPAHAATDRCWHECSFDIPGNACGSHEFIFETRSLDDSFDSRWAVWREPRFVRTGTLPVTQHRTADLNPVPEALMS
jgi:hypothetical protein